MQNAVNKMKLNDNSNVCCVYATNPLLFIETLKIGLKLIDSSPLTNYVTTVTKYPFPIQRALKVNKTGKLEINYEKYMMTNSQDLPIMYHECAQFWWGKGITWKKSLPMQKKVTGIFIPNWLYADIDNEEDWKTAELKFQILNKFKSLKLDLISQIKLV